MSGVKRVCRLCDKGFPIKAGVHYGTQSLGMIPSRLCDNASSEEAAAWKRIAAPPVVEQVKCVKCGHKKDDPKTDSGVCQVSLRGILRCGCHCVFPTATPVNPVRAKTLTELDARRADGYEEIMLEKGTPGTMLQMLADINYLRTFVPTTEQEQGGDESGQEKSVDAAKGTVAPTTAIEKDSSESAVAPRPILSSATLKRIRTWASDGRDFIDSLTVRDLLSHANSQQQYLNDIAQIADVGSAAEFGDALERVESISRLLRSTTQASSGLPSQDVPDHSPASPPESSSEPAPESQGVGQCTELHKRLARYKELIGNVIVSMRLLLLTQTDLPCSPGFLYELYAKGHEINTAREVLAAAREVITDKEKQMKKSVNEDQELAGVTTESEIQLPGLDAFVRTIIERISGAAIELAIMRHSLNDQDGDEPDREAIDLIKSDIVDCMTGDEIGCNDPSEIDETNCKLIWLKAQLTNADASSGTTQPG